VQDFESIDQLPNLTSALIECGWRVTDIRKLLGENWLRVYRAAWGR
jgi:membrane dipeptidase